MFDGKLVIYGCGGRAREVANTLCDSGYNIEFFVDSDRRKQGTLFQDKYLIQSPDMLNDDKAYAVVVTPVNNKEIIGDLLSKGYIQGQNLFLYEDIMRSVLFAHADRLFTYLNENKIDFSVVFAPDIRKMVNCSEVESALKTFPQFMDPMERTSWLQSGPPFIRKIHKDIPYNSDEYIKNIFTYPEIFEKNGTLEQAEMSSKYVNVSAGIRVTTDQPDYYNKTIHLLGPSFLYGTGVEDKYTIPSCLQRNLNENGYKYCCINHGIRGLLFYQYLNKIKSFFIDKEDYLIIYTIDNVFVKEYLMINKIPFIDINDFLWKERKELIFLDQGHLNYKGNKQIADIIFDIVFKDGLKSVDYKSVNLNREAVADDSISISSEIKGSIEKWIKENVKGGGYWRCIRRPCRRYSNELQPIYPGTLASYQYSSADC